MTDNCPTPQNCPFDQQKMGKMFQMVKDTREDVREIKLDVKSQNGRVSNLENWRWYLVGMFGATLFFLKIGGVI